MKKYIGLLFAMLVMVSCESLEDTYEDFAGNGPVRYLGKCTDLTIQPGWNRLQVRWTNSPDQKQGKKSIQSHALKFFFVISMDFPPVR